MAALVFTLSGVYGTATFYSDPTDSIEDQYIVVLDSNVTAEQRKDVISKFSDLGAVISNEYECTINGFSASMNEKLLTLLLEHPLVSYVDRDRIMRISADPQCTTQAPCPWGLSRINHPGHKDVDAFSYDQSVGGDGKGVTAYVIDTGIQLTHKEFEGRATFGFTAFEGDTEEPTTDCNGHGTHVAGTIGGKSVGVAKSTSLVSVKVLSCEGSGPTSGVIAGIDYACVDCNQKYEGENNRCVANLSLGGFRNAATNDAVNKAVKKGLVMVVAAGNENMNACTKSPASADEAISIGATMLDNDNIDRRADFSNWGPCVDLFAPGQEIVSAWIDEGYPDRTYNTISGTSMASPHAAGVVAQYLAGTQYSTDPAPEAWEYKGILVDAADPDEIEFHCINARGEKCNDSPNLELQSVFCS
eukprot:CAMPEP_0201522866 /NCGR_PEP_ID=MMETSP0161_2-20130828/18596_1 /ASSEMBLY_ACC=CAM_ASM_000251 /TAXON_ID=180227 /ORGANISM="Neoparamoeba aestuarina, Strain SoJaBio B1-5/56/2" /LENGTH=415 /DNA_ID=CAMNT_0047921819 /DNA_START=86 /DNA_END=1333 /DNA_ORIENTATION=-